MTKRASGKFERRERDYYATPPEPIYRLLPHLGDVFSFAEPMCGDGAIVRVLEEQGWVCRFASDLEPQGEMASRAEVCDAMDLGEDAFSGVDAIITNPPWPAVHQRGQPTTGLVEHLSQFRPTWMLLSADFAHTVYAAPLLTYCTKIVSVGRVSWMGNGVSGYDNVSWYRFDQEASGPPSFFGAGKDKPQLHPDIQAIL